MSDKKTQTKKTRRPSKCGVSLSSKHHYSRAEREEIMRRKTIEEALAKGSGMLPPDWIDENAEKIFCYVIETYKKLGLTYLNDLDMNALAMYSEALAEYIHYKNELPKIRADIEKLRDSDWEDDEDHAKALIALMKAKGLAERNMLVQQRIFIDLAKNLGLTPEGRVKMAVTKEDNTPDAIAWFQSLQQNAIKKGTPDA